VAGFQLEVINTLGVYLVWARNLFFGALLSNIRYQTLNDYFCFFIFSHSKFDVGRSMFDVHLFSVNLPFFHFDNCRRTCYHKHHAFLHHFKKVTE